MSRASGPMGESARPVGTSEPTRVGRAASWHDDTRKINERFCKGSDNEASCASEIHGTRSRESSWSTHASDMVESEPLIPEGQYKVEFVSYRTLATQGKGKLEILFRVAEGDHEGVLVKAFFPVTLNGRAKKFGDFKVSRQGAYFEQLSDLFPDLADRRADRISPSRLRNQIVRVEIVTVKTKWDGSKRKKATQYSKVSKMLRLEQ